jgi:cytoskeleton protein RodZ
MYKFNDFRISRFTVLGYKVMRDNNISENLEQKVDLSLLPNEYLADVRKKKGIEERQAADALKISVSRLRSIEKGDYTVFPSATYVRGHLRKYSRFLDVDEEAMVKAYNSANPPLFDFVNPENNSKEKIASGSSASKRSLKFSSIIIFLIILWMAAYGYFSQSSKGFTDFFSFSGSEQSSLEVGEAQPNQTDVIKKLDVDNSPLVEDKELADDSELMSPSDISDAANLDIIELAGGVNRDSSVESSVESSVQNILVIPLENVVTESEIIVSKVTAAELVRSIKSEDVFVSPELTEADAHVLTFSFVNPCWVKVTDVSGTVIFAGLKASDSNLRLTGDAPFDIVLGNVDGTSLSYNDSPVILEPQENGRPLRLVVGK